MLKVNYCGKEAQERMTRNGWWMILAEYNETADELYSRLVSGGYRQVKVYWTGTMIRGIHKYFAFVK